MRLPRPSRWIPIFGLGALAYLLLEMLLRPIPPEQRVDAELARAALPALDRSPTVRRRGRLVDARGLPVREALLVGQSGGRPFWTHSDERGEFTLEDAPPGNFELLVVVRGFESTSHSVRSESDQIVIELGAQRPAPPRIDAPAPSRLHGRLAEREGIERYTGCGLLFLPLGDPSASSTPMPRWTTVEEGGTFLVGDLAPGTYRALLLPEWAGESRWPDLLSPLDGSQPFTFEHPFAAGSELVLPVIAGTIQGSIHRLPRGAGSGGAPQALEGATIWALPETSPVPGLVFGPSATDATGRFVLRDLPPGNYRVHARVGVEERVKSETVHREMVTVLDFDPFE